MQHEWSLAVFTPGYQWSAGGTAHQEVSRKLHGQPPTGDPKSSQESSIAGGQSFPCFPNLTSQLSFAPWKEA